MKKRIFLSVALVAIMVLSLSLVGCNGGTRELSTVPKVAMSDYEILNDDRYRTIAKGMNDFCARLTSALYADSDTNDNVVISPLSLYMALSMVAECQGDDDRTSTLEMLGVDYDTLSTCFTDIYEAISRDDRDDLGKLRTALNITNSIWLDETVAFNKDCIDNLATNYYCHSHKTRFARDNAGANRAIRRFVKENTRGLIDKKYQFDSLTYFAIINTVYLKDVWNALGDNLKMTDSEYSFEGNNSTSNLKMLVSEYIPGKVLEGEKYSTFYTSTYNDYDIKFLVPRDGYTLDDIMDENTLSLVNSTKEYDSVDEEHKVKYHTRCIFPEFYGSYEGSLDDVLAKEFGFGSLYEMDRLLTSHLDGGTTIYHSARLEVNRRGIEGAAMTVFPGCGAPGPDGYEHIYADFVIDKSFGYIVSTNGMPIFAGVVNNIE